MPDFASTMAIVLSIVVAAWLHNKHTDALDHCIDDTNRRIDETNRRIDKFRAEIIRLEENSAPIVHF